ncbi:hypothetical protein HOL34_01355 [bacterium]|jgi:hypothetical protein|nr:hypothetical protein [bacterium]MBT3903571.1 hypothetical protein [bacterium]MBT4577921.1 hypothetical protein [bacterium]MBT5345714.1 hypothetical protein [bacterium]MBT6130796.1 hypothetical protein [bacterium]
MLLEMVRTVPGHIFVGSASSCHKKIEQLLVELFCKKNGCGSCHDCKQISKRSYHALCWLSPEKGYTVESIRRVVERSVLVLDKDSHFVFVFDRAQTLSNACSNAILKTLEEVSLGYHFFFVTNNKQSLLPTIVSRCLVTDCGYDDNTPLSLELCMLMQEPGSIPGDRVLKIFEQIKGVDQDQAIGLANQLMTHWLRMYRAALEKGESEQADRAYRALNVVQDMLQRPPMPGGVRLFLETLFARLLVTT